MRRDRAAPPAGHLWQAARDVAALAPAHFRIDDRTLPERISRFHAIAALFRTGQRGEAQATVWADLLEKDPVFLLADAATYDASGQYRRHRAQAASAGLAAEGRDRIDAWAARAAAVTALQGAGGLGLEFRALISEIVADEFDGFTLGDAAFRDEALGRIFAAAPPDAPRLEGRALDSAMMRAAGRISDSAGDLLERSLAAPGDHPADTGLALAFLSL